MLLPIWIVHFENQKKKELAVLRQIKKRRGETDMLKAVEGYLGKNCELHTIERNYEGQILRIEDGWIVVFDRYFKSEVLVNPEYVIGIREHKLKEKKQKPESEQA